jgi:hypothetical protein
LASGCGKEAEKPADPVAPREPEAKGEPKRSTAPAEAIPATVALPATQAMTSGFASGVLRDQVDLAAFRITRNPITRAQYGQCVEAGACAESKNAGCAPTAFEQLRGRSTAEPESPHVCSTVTEAASYCSWIGGRLPVFPEWLLAARGPSPQRFAWGDSEPGCDRHPRAADVDGAFLTEEAAQEAGCVPPVEAPLVIGEHAAGAAASGMEDVLLTPAELLAPQATAQFSACSSGFAGCFVYGHTPGEIDAVFPIDKPSAKAPAEQRAPLVYGFRCVLEEN